MHRGPKRGQRTGPRSRTRRGEDDTQAQRLSDLEVQKVMTERSPKTGQYTKEMHEAYRKEQDEKAAKEAQERDHRRQRMERANARRA